MSLVPLVIDLDGTLIRSDLLVESSFSLIHSKPHYLLAPFRWLASGKAYFKEHLANVSEIDVASLPYEPHVIDFIKQERAKGREIILATASHKIYAKQIASHLGLFDRVLATEGQTNLAANNKRDRLVREFGEKGYDYMGNSRADLPVWKSARQAYIVNPDPGVLGKAKKFGNVAKIISTPRNPIKLWAIEFRFHQWLKNLLIFVPLLASHQLNNIDLLLNGLLAFIFFGLCSSSAYVLNDLLDLEHDRFHPTKSKRPFASGLLPIKAGLFIFPALLIVAFSGAQWLVSLQFTAVLALYYLITLLYSMLFKRIMGLDIITLASLYTLRIVAGTFAFNVSLTFWMLAFSMFIFLSLALVKRYAELRHARNEGRTSKTRGRGYYPEDLEMISSLGASSGYLSVMVLALYIQDQATMALYRYPQFIWLACPVLLFWITRVWLLAHRGEMHDDPVIYAIQDRISLLTGILFGTIFWFAA